jgi:hypothetical protein
MFMDSKTEKLIKAEFLAFAMKAFASLNKGKSLGNDLYLKLLAERLTRVAARKTKRLVVSLPPRHFKTFMGSICLPAWILAHNPSAKIIILTYGQDLADKIAYAVRDILDLPGHVWQKGGWKQLKLPLIATRRHKYDLGDGEVWERKKG